MRLGWWKGQETSTGIAIGKSLNSRCPVGSRGEAKPQEWVGSQRAGSVDAAKNGAELTTVISRRLGDDIAPQEGVFA